MADAKDGRCPRERRAADAFEAVARLEDVPVGTLLAVRTSAGEKICLINDEGDLYAVSDTCTHQDFPLSEGHVSAGKIECVWHGAQFDLRTGKATKLPAVKPLPVYELRVENGRILVGGRIQAREP